jgi:hypothetical protein
MLIHASRVSSKHLRSATNACSSFNSYLASYLSTIFSHFSSAIFAKGIHPIQVGCLSVRVAEVTCIDLEATYVHKREQYMTFQYRAIFYSQS